MKILTFYAYRLRDKRFFAFILFVLQAAAKFPVIGQNFAKYVERLQAAYDHLNRIYLKYDPAFYTEQLQKADNERTLAFRELNDNIRLVQLYSKDSGKKNCAEILSKVIRLYVGTAGIGNETMADRTATIVNVVEDFEQVYPNEIAELGFGDKLQELKDKQEAFYQLYLDRTETDAEMGTGAMESARRKTWETYREFVNIVNYDVDYDTEKLLSPFIKFLNVEIRRNFRYTGQTAGSEDSAGDDSGEEEPLPEHKVTLTFRSADNHVYTREGHPGDEYEVPENGAGLIWVTRQGLMGLATGVFPEEDLEFVELAAGLPEDTFHYIGGEHLTFTGAPGTAYIVPPSTTGYVWSPEASGRIGESSQQFFEKLIGSEGGDNTNPGGGSGETTEPDHVRAFFVFANGDEETISGLPGSPMQPPINTVGYMWQPAPPRIIPTQDTTYREVEYIDDWK